MVKSSSSLLAACFCAAWCRTCDDYKNIFDGLKAEYSGRVEFLWIDIEDQADILDDIDVENFPTLLIAKPGQVYFWGPVLPHASNASNLINRIILADHNATSVTSDIIELELRLRSLLIQ